MIWVTLARIVSSTPRKANASVMLTVLGLASYWRLGVELFPNVDVPVELMQKRHKVAVVRDLKDRGMFHLRDAIDMIATTLGVTRFTIYNYLNEIADEDAVDSDDEPLQIGKEG